MYPAKEIRSMRSHVLLFYVSANLWGTGVGQRLRNGLAGQSMVEYAIVVAVVAIIAMAGVQAFGQGISQVFQHLLSKIQSLGS